MKLIFVLLGIIEISISYGCKSPVVSAPIVNNASQLPVPVKMDQDIRLVKLRQDLDQIRAKQFEAASEPYESPYHDASVLVGLRKTEIQKALGDPGICGERSNPLCQETGDWFYSFYYLPSPSVGGGSQLLLRFNGQEKCVSVKWIMTQ